MALSGQRNTSASPGSAAGRKERRCVLMVPLSWPLLLVLGQRKWSSCPLEMWASLMLTLPCCSARGSFADGTAGSGLRLCPSWKGALACTG